MIPSEYQIELKTLTYDLCYEVKLELPAVVRYLQQAAHEHATRLGVGYHELKKQDVYWVLSSLTVEVNELPGFDESFVVKTWPVDQSGVLTSRDFCVIQNQQTIAWATSSWMIIDLKRKRPVRPDSFLNEIPFNPDHHAVNERGIRLHMPDEKELIEERMVRYSDLDINRHVNNVRYLEWLLDLVDRSKFRDRKIHGFTLQFSGEFLKDEKASIFLSSPNNHTLFLEIIHPEKSNGILCKISFV